MSFEGSAIISFPASKRARVNAQGFCQFLLGYARKATIVDYPVPEGFSLDFERRIAEKFDDSWYIM